MTDSQAPARADRRSVGPEAAWGGDGAHPGSPGVGLAALGALGIVHLAVRYGFFDRLDLPASLAAAAEREPLLAGVDVAHASWFVSRATLSRGPDPAMAAWRKRLFISLAHNAADPAQTFGLPADRTVVMGTRLEI